MAPFEMGHLRNVATVNVEKDEDVERVNDRLFDPTHEVLSMC